MRWEPGTRDRLRRAALDLYLEQGYEATTVDQIAARVGVTERTYFRHFADKREVLFDAEDNLAAAFVDGLASAPDGPPLTIVATALEASATFFDAERRPWSRARQTVIDANPALREREMLKLDSLRASLTTAMRARGVTEPAASVAAATGMSIFHVAFTQWIAEGETRELAVIEREMLAELRVLTAT